MTTNNINMIDLADENFSFSSRAKRLAEEIRIPVMITSVTLVGNEVFKATDGKETVSYKIGIGFTSNAPHVSDSGRKSKDFTNSTLNILRLLVRRVLYLRSAW